MAKVTSDNKWLAAAEKAALAVNKKYMVEGCLNFNGGELDDIMANDGVHSKLNCWCITGVMYGCMGLGALALLTKKPEHIALVRHAGDWMLANQFLRDTHYGYYQRKARFQGSDLKTAGSPQGCVRPENTCT